MPVRVSTLVALIYNTGSGVIDRCKVVQQCPREAARIALRTQNVLGLLRDAAEGFAGNLALERSLLELREVLERIAHLVERCTQPARLSMRVLRAFRITATKESLLAAEDNLERVTRDLRLPLLASVRAQLDEVLHEPSSAEAAVLSTRGNDAAEDGLPVVGERDEASSAVPECGVEGDELILETARGAIEEGMKTPTNESGGASIEEVIRDELLLAKSLLAAIPLPPALEGLFEEGHLGHGTFGVVVAGKYLGRDVAIKKARAPIQTAKTLQAFRKEAETQFVMRHPNIVETFAFSIGDAENPPCLVMERMQESLYGLLTHDYIIDFRGALDIILAVCEALRFLHTYNIVHSNVKSTNVLLGRNGTAKVSDFSLARVSATVNADTGGGSHGKVGGLYWTAPEVQSHRKATALSDIFSLHVVMWEAITNQVASEDLPIGERLLRAPNARLSLEGCAASTGPARSLVERAQSLLDRCGSIDNYRRPTINEIIPEIAALCNEATSTRARSDTAPQNTTTRKEAREGGEMQGAMEAFGLPGELEGEGEGAEEVEEDHGEAWQRNTGREETDQEEDGEEEEPREENELEGQEEQERQEEHKEEEEEEEEEEEGDEEKEKHEEKTPRQEEEEQTKPASWEKVQQGQVKEEEKGKLGEKGSDEEDGVGEDEDGAGEGRSEQEAWQEGVEETPDDKQGDEGDMRGEEEGLVKEEKTREGRDEDREVEAEVVADEGVREKGAEEDEDREEQGFAEEEKVGEAGGGEAGCENESDVKEGVWEKERSVEEEQAGKEGGEEEEAVTEDDELHGERGCLGGEEEGAVEEVRTREDGGGDESRGEAEDEEGEESRGEAEGEEGEDMEGCGVIQSREQEADVEEVSTQEGGGEEGEGREEVDEEEADKVEGVREEGTEEGEGAAEEERVLGERDEEGRTENSDEGAADALEDNGEEWGREEDGAAVEEVAIREEGGEVEETQEEIHEEEVDRNEDVREEWTADEEGAFEEEQVREEEGEETAMQETNEEACGEEEDDDGEEESGEEDGTAVEDLRAWEEGGEEEETRGEVHEGEIDKDEEVREEGKGEEEGAAEEREVREEGGEEKAVQETDEEAGEEEEDKGEKTSGEEEGIAVEEVRYRHEVDVEDKDLEEVGAPEGDGRVLGDEDTEVEARQQGLAPPGVAVTVAAAIAPEAVEDVEPSPASVELPVKMGAPAGVAAAGARVGSLRANVQETLCIGTSRPNVHGDPQQQPWLIPAALSATATEEPHRAVDHGICSYDSEKGRPEPMSALAHVPENTIGDSEDGLAEAQRAHAIEKVSTEENRAASTEITKKHGKPSGGGNRDDHGTGSDRGNVGTVDGDLKKAVSDDAGKPGLAGASCAAAGATAVGEVPGSVGWRDSVHGEPDAGLLLPKHFPEQRPPSASAIPPEYPVDAAAKASRPDDYQHHGYGSQASEHHLAPRIASVDDSSGDGESSPLGVQYAGTKSDVRSGGHRTAVPAAAVSRKNDPPSSDGNDRTTHGDGGGSSDSSDTEEIFGRGTWNFEPVTTAATVGGAARAAATETSGTGHGRAQQKPYGDPLLPTSFPLRQPQSAWAAPASLPTRVTLGPPRRGIKMGQGAHTKTSGGRLPSAAASVDCSDSDAEESFVDADRPRAPSRVRGGRHRAAPPAASAFAALASTNDRPSGYHDRLSIGGGGSSDSDAQETFCGGTRKPGSVTTANVAAALAAVVVKERPVAVPPRRAGGGYRLLTTSGRGLQQRREFFVGAALYNSGGCAGLDGSGSSTEQSDGEDFTEGDDSDVITELGDGGRAREQEPRARGNGKHDRAVLMVLFEQCRGRNWRHSENWGSGKPLSSWYNVTVDRGSHVKRIVLSRNRICGTLPADLGMLAFLEELRLHSNSLKGEIPRFIGGLRSLIHLDLHDNNLSGRIPKEIGNLGALESLDLSKNQLSGHIPEEIGDLTLLKTLVLRKNKLSGKIPPRLGALAGLESFDLSGNLLKGPIPAELGDLEALTELMIGRNRLGGEIPAELGRLSNLLVLELHDNQLSGNVPPELLGLRGLQHLELDGNDLQPVSGQTGDAPLHPMATKAVGSSVSGAGAGTSESGRRRGTTSTPQVMPSATTAAVSEPDGNPSSRLSGGGGKAAEAVPDDASSTEGPSSPDTPSLPYPVMPRALEQERSSHEEKGGQRGLLPPAAAAAAAPAAAACDSAGGERVPDDPREGGGPVREGASVAIVARFDSSPSEYCASDGSVRLRVRPGCLRPGQVAGPITLTTTPGCLVECGRHPYLISLVVDCQPSGATFDSPLDLDFRVGGELDEEDGWAGDRRDFDECFASLRDNTKVLQRDREGDPWNAVEQGDTDIYHDGIAFFVRARVRHFSQVCLSKRVQLENAIHEDPVAWPSWAPPKRKQIGFVNATDGPLIFLVLPTSWSQKAIMSVAVGVAFEGLEARAAMSKAVRQSILTEATQPQMLQVPCTKRRGNPRVGQAFPFATCTLPKATGGEARVALIRASGDTVEVWDYRIVQQRTWVWVLPGQFSEGMMPLLGTHRRQDLAQGVTCLMDVALMATAKGLQSIDGGSAPTSILSSEGGSASTDGGDANSTG